LIKKFILPRGSEGLKIQVVVIPFFNSEQKNEGGMGTGEREKRGAKTCRTDPFVGDNH
jgi:hypothetical protein